MANCANCGAAVSEGFGVQIPGRTRKDPPTMLCANCAGALERRFQEETEGPNLVGGLLVGVVAAGVGSLAWFGIVIATNYELGILAIALGWIVAQGVIWGSGKKRGPALQLLSVGLTLAAMIASEYLIIRHFAVETLAEKEQASVPILLPLDLALELILEGLKTNPMTLLFWAIAVWEAFALPARRKLRRAEVRGEVRR